MSTLYTFGCSFTEEFKEFMAPPINMMNGRVEYVVDYHNGIPPNGWTTILSEKLGYQLKNYSGCNGFNRYQNNSEGNCNFSIFNNLCYASESFKKDDIVIVEWTMMNRFKWYDENVKTIRSILPNLLCTDDPDTIKTLEHILVNRVNPPWIDQLFIHQKMINRLSETIGFKLFYWTIDRSIVKHKYNEIINDKRYLLTDKIKRDGGYIDLLCNEGARTIDEESKGKIKDGHFGISGHKVISELFYDDIVKKI